MLDSRAIGASLRAEANDLKRTVEGVAAETGLSCALVASVFSGQATIAECDTVQGAMLRVYPIDARRMARHLDDTDHGVRVVDAAQALASERIIPRRFADGTVAPYYAYRDTAMSRESSIRPEWIVPLVCVPEEDARSGEGAQARIVFNNGHLLHQVTYFLGPIDVHWKRGGEVFTRAMSAGDSCHFPPFVPHSFTQRQCGGTLGIVAVTYAGPAKQAFRELRQLGSDGLDAFLGRTAGLASSTPLAHAVARAAALRCLDTDTWTRALAAQGVARERLHALLQGDSLVGDEHRAFSQVFGDHEHWHQVSACAPGAVTCESRPTARRTIATGVRIAELVRPAGPPAVAVPEVTIEGGCAVDLRCGLSEYLFNVGGGDLSIDWAGGRRVLEPGGSAFIRPTVAHRIAATTSPVEVLLVRVAGQLDPTVAVELERWEPGGESQIFDPTQWF